MHKRIESLDGLRGLAIGMVLWLHFFGSAIGWAGVDVFFILSGYLITTILLSAREEPHFWRIFYTRRATRIIPAYVVTMLTTFAFFRLEWHLIWPYYVFFAANWAAAVSGFNVGPLSPLWSLAVEEHFYFLWPLCVRKCPRKTLFVVLISIVVAEPLIRTLSYVFHPLDWRAYYMLTPFRLDGLALGALLGLALAESKTRERLQVSGAFVPWALAFSFSCFILPIIVLNQDWQKHQLVFFSVGFSGVDLTAALLLLFLILRPESRITKFFSMRPLRFLGRISYGLYLYHIPIQQMIWRIGDHYAFTHHKQINIISLPVSILFAWLSFRFFETPFLDLGKRTVDRYRLRPARI
jgi:peptidoglycan/LPS O-acetylase OafA/YrhL